MEQHIITLCLVILAYDKLKPLARSLRNWAQRQQIHRQHVKRLEEEHG